MRRVILALIAATVIVLLWMTLKMGEKHDRERPECMTRWRVYIKDDKGELMRLPKKFLDDCGSSKFSLRQFAGTTQKLVTVYWEGKIIRSISTSYIEFDAEGFWDVLAGQERL